MFRANRAAARHHLPEVAKVGSILYILRDEFTTAAGAPLTSPRNAEPGPGQWNVLDTTNKLTISSNRLQWSGFNNVFDPSLLGTALLARAIGRALIGLVQSSNAGSIDQLVWENQLTATAAAINTGRIAGLTSNAGSVFNAMYNNGSVQLIALSEARTPGTDYIFAVILRSIGAFYFIKQAGTWKLSWLDAINNAASLAPCISVVANFAGNSDFARVRDLPAPFTTDNGIAENNITSFTQSAGSELLTNGNFAAWTADNPDNWTVSGEVASDPMVTQVAPGGGAGSGAARLFSSATNSLPQILQNILSASTWYEISVKVDTRVSGTVEVSSGNSNFANVYSTTGVKNVIVKNGVNTGFRIRGGSAAPTDITVDDASVKLLTLNAQATMDANSIIDFKFAVPGSPVAGQTAELRYRIQDDQNYWVAYLVRNDTNTGWLFNVDSVSAGVATNRIAAGAISVDATSSIRVICDGNLHDVYTSIVAVWTKRGGQINNASFNTATGLNAVYATGTTPTSLISYKRASSVYNVLDAA